MLRSTGFGLRLHAVGENPRPPTSPASHVNRTRYVALGVGSALMAVGGSFLTLAVLGSYTLDIVSGRGWVCIALVIFAQWRVWPVVGGALIFALTDALQLQLAITTDVLATCRTSCCSRCPTSPSSPRSPSGASRSGTPRLTSRHTVVAEPHRPREGLMSITDEELLAAAIAEARTGLAEGGIPIGAALVVDGEVLAVGHNRRVQLGSADPARRDRLPGERRPAAGVGLRRARTMVTTLSPCDMCTGAILLYEIPRVVVGENRTFYGGEELLRSRGVEVVVLDDAECIAMMTRLHRRQPAAVERGHRGLIGTGSPAPMSGIPDMRCRTCH